MTSGRYEMHEHTCPACLSAIGAFLSFLVVKNILKSFTNIKNFVIARSPAHGFHWMNPLIKDAAIISLFLISATWEIVSFYPHKVI